VAGPADDRHVTVPVGAVGVHAVGGQQVQQPVARVPVGVVRADRHQRDGGATGRQEPGIGVRAAVVGHLEHVGGQIGAPGRDPGLGLRAQVAGEEHPDAALGDADDQAQVVGVSPRGGSCRVRREHLELGGAH